jgi:hypothetical protein
MAELQEGKYYRIALTNHRGLYRQLLEDVFYMEGWHAATPVLQFSHRWGYTASVTGEKLTEQHVVAALAHARDVSGVDFAEAQAAPVWGKPPYYVLMLQPQGEPDEARLRSFLVGFEQRLSQVNLEYRSKRQSERLGPPCLAIVPHAVFLDQRLQAASGRSDAQVKIPRLRPDRVLPEEIGATSMLDWVDPDSAR